MDEIINIDTASVEYTEAIKLHNEILTNGAIAANALFELCKDLRRMRDEKLYIQLGYKDFGDYCEQKANIKKRQAYNYIKAYESLGRGFLQSNAELGITKLELLTHVPAIERSEFAEKNDLQSISVSELQKKVDELRAENGQKAEQLELFRVKADAADEKQAEIDRLAAELDELKSRPIDVAIAEPDIKALKKAEADKKAEIKAAAEIAVRKAIDKERKAQQDELSAAVSAKDEEYKNIIEGYRKKLDERDKTSSEAMQKAHEMEERLKAAQTDNAAKFRIYFEQVNDDVGKVFDALKDVSDETTHTKFCDKLEELGTLIANTAESVK